MNSNEPQPQYTSQVGEEVSDCYGCHYTSSTLPKRQQKLLQGFHFSCSCMACTSAFPVMAALPDLLPQKHLDLLQVPWFLRS